MNIYVQVNVISTMGNFVTCTRLQQLHKHNYNDYNIKNNNNKTNRPKNIDERIYDRQYLLQFNVK